MSSSFCPEQGKPKRLSGLLNLDIREEFLLREILQNTVPRELQITRIFHIYLSYLVFSTRFLCESKLSREQFGDFIKGKQSCMIMGTTQMHIDALCF